MKEMKRVKTMLCVAVIVAIFAQTAFLGGWLLSGLTLVTQRVEKEPSIGTVKGLGDYDPGVKCERVDEGSLPEGIEYRMWFESYDNETGRYYVMDAPIFNVEGDKSISALALVSNQTDHDLDGLKLFYRLPGSIGYNRVVADAMTLSIRLEYDDMVAQKQLDLIGDKAPIGTSFIGGYAGFLSKNGNPMELLPVYDNYEIQLFDYWQNEGMELNIPAGETWAIQVHICTSELPAIESETYITDTEGRMSGSRLKTSTLLGEKKTFHIVSKAKNVGEVEYPVKIWVTFHGNVQLVPGSVRLDGEPIDDFVLQENPQRTDEDQNFKTFCGPILPKGETMCLEYDIECGEYEEASNISCMMSAEGYSRASAYTVVSCQVADISMDTIKEMILSLLLLWMCIVYMLVLWRRYRKGAE